VEQSGDAAPATAGDPPAKATGETVHSFVVMFPPRRFIVRFCKPLLRM